MRHRSLFDPPESYQSRLKELKERLGENADILLQVELSFALMECLNLDDEPVTAVWAILSGMPLYHPTLQNLTPEQRRAIANARQIIPLSSRFAWLNALRIYFQRIDAYERNYNLENLENLDDKIINACKEIRHPNHQQLYEICLREILPFHHVNINQVQADKKYQFDAHTVEGVTNNVQVKFKSEHLGIQQQFCDLWFGNVHHREAFYLNLNDLQEIAQFLDDRENRLTLQYNWQNEQKGNWLKRYQKIHFHPVVDGQLSTDDAPKLELDGFSHIPGMVASGKSTLCLLLAAYRIRQESDRRMTLVVGDVQSALQLTNLINWWFCNDPESDAPVAVPLLGHSQRDRHLREFHGSRDYLEHQERGQPHWGERWLRVECPLQGLISPSDMVNQLNNEPITPGREPCRSLQEVPPANERKKSNPYCLCPLFNICPSHQLYRDLPQAKIWITTPGAMSLGGIPRQLESRPIKVGELVYEQSDLVIFDEADTIVEWFDYVYAEEVGLTNGKDGVFDKMGLATERHMVLERTPNQPTTQRWVGAQRDSQKAITATLTLLSEHEILKEWVSNSYFTPHALFYKLSRRLSGLEEYDPQETSQDSSRDNDRLTEETVGIFDRLFLNDPLRPQLPRRSDDPIESSAYRLALLMQEINNTGESAFDEDIFNNCKTWIRDFFPDLPNKLEELQKVINARNAQMPKKRGRKRKNNEDSDRVDTIGTLARRLQFALTTALLDRHTRIVFYEWYSRPNSIEGEQPHRKMPTSMLNILPLPPTGKQFGTYYSRKEEGDRNKRLSIFAYTNIGRCYVLNFDRLLTDLDGRRGPNVLALSGTSYLPDSTKFHVGDSQALPQGVLMPEETARNAIAESRFSFLPQYDRNDRPIRISGSPERKKHDLFKDIAKTLVGNQGRGLLNEEMEELKSLGENDEKWRDRDRLLLFVNSYDQCKWVADEIRQQWLSQRDFVYHLRRGGVTDDSKLGRYFKERGGLARTDIETFASIGGKILVAPMHAIGRGFNILNSQGKAAFGAVYFLTRSYPHPDDTRAIAQEVNRRALDWANDPDFIAWQEDGILKRAQKVRKLASDYWRSVEQRSYYSTLRDNEILRARPRQDLAATTAGYIIQAVGRLLRGGVPFHAYFVDAAWAINYAREEQKETPETSLLAAIIDLLRDYVAEDPICKALYQPLTDAICGIENFGQ